MAAEAATALVVSVVVAVGETMVEVDDNEVVDAINDDESVVNLDGD